MLRANRMVWAACAALAMQFTGPARAAPEDYRLEAAGQPVRAGAAIVVRLRLVHVPDGKPVPGAILIQPKLEMGMAGHGNMAAPAKVGAPQAEPGLYAVEVRPAMGGEWTLSVGAKVPGEAGTVRGRVTLNLAQ